MSEPEVVRLETAEKYQARVNYWKGRAENAERLLDKERERAQFNDEVRREQIRIARAEAWDEGWHAAEDFAGQVYAWNASEGETEVRETTNPYRTGTANAHL